MQIDFHHAATYVVARLAGFTHPDAVVIAYASQYVDDSTNKGTIHFDNGTSYTRIASAHEVFDVHNNLSNVEDYQVWVPFHFLPGNNGLSADQPNPAPLAQRLICTPDSPLAADMWAACHATKGQPNSLHRLGITSHVYCDTFSHQLYAGIRHDVNLTYDIDYIHPAASDLLDRIEGLAADALKLGHGGALTDPDLPFLTWTYKNNHKQPVQRPNPQLFLDACQRLFAQYTYYLELDPSRALSAAELSLLQQTILTNTSHDPGTRHQGWLSLLQQGAFNFPALTPEELSEVQYIPLGPGSWKHAALGNTPAKDDPNMLIPYNPGFESSNWRLFHEALKDHQSTVLNQLLPQYGLPSTYADAQAQL